MRCSLSLQSAFLRLHLFCLLLCRMVNVKHAARTSGVSANACGYLGLPSAGVSPLHEGYRFAKLACDWWRSTASSQVGESLHLDGTGCRLDAAIASAIDFTRRPFALRSRRVIYFACYSMIILAYF